MHQNNKSFVLFALVAAVQGLIPTFIAMIAEAVVAAFVPGFTLPFSPWWGMLFSIPGLYMAVFIWQRRW